MSEIDDLRREVDELRRLLAEATKLLLDDQAEIGEGFIGFVIVIVRVIWALDLAGTAPSAIVRRELRQLFGMLSKEQQAAPRWWPLQQALAMLDEPDPGASPSSNVVPFRPRDA